MYGLDLSMVVVSESSDDGEELEHLEPSENVGKYIFMFNYSFTIYSQDDNLIEAHREMQRSISNMTAMAIELCRGMGMDVNALHQALDDEDDMQSFSEIEDDR
jgi:GTP cyclohydrolase III